jgi:hypothetical protein
MAQGDALQAPPVGCDEATELRHSLKRLARGLREVDAGDEHT